MISSLRRRIGTLGSSLALLLTLFSSPAQAAAPAWQDELGRRALQHEDYDSWNRVTGAVLSRDGRWAGFSIRPAKGQVTLKIREVKTQKEYSVAGGSRLRFSHDSRYAAYMIQPDPEVVKSLRKKGKKSSELPKAKLQILDLVEDRHVTLQDVRSMTMPEEGSGWIAYVPEEPGADVGPKAGTVMESEAYSIQGGALAAPGREEAPAGEPEKKTKEKREKENGDVLVLRSLTTGVERRFPNVTSHRFSKFGARLALATSATDAEADGVHVVELADGAVTQIASGRGSYRSLSFSEDEQQLSFVTDRDDYGPEKPSVAIHHWKAGDEAAQKIVDESSEGMPEGWWIATSRPTFTEDGRRLLFDTQPRPEDAGKTAEELKKEKEAKELEPQAVVDIWHWKDDALQPQQLLRANRERNRGYRALYDVEAGKMVQLATLEIPSVRVSASSTADVAVGISDKKYAVSRSWEAPGFSDSYIVDLVTGESALALEKVRGTATLSPGGRYLTWWDADAERLMAMSVEAREPFDMGAGIPTSLANELHDTPSPPRSYGLAGWREDDASALVYDRYDIWQVDPAAPSDAVCLTGQSGREDRTRYRYQRLDFEERFVPAGEPLLLSVFNEATKASGYSRLVPGGAADDDAARVEPLLLLDERVGSATKAKDASTLLLTRETFRRSPDLWATSTEFEDLARLSWANPQQREFLWGTAELVHYETTGGTPLDGILYKPDNFDPSHKYPMMVYFYERSSDGLHRYVVPAATRASINYSFYASRGYVIFVPDIPYETGTPGQSAANAILPGIQTVVDMGFVDEARIGVQGHSWGGYQIAYLVTMTNVFACAEAGAPVSNMTSAYGGIRWASGLSRMFQYEKTQSRIGDTLWNARELYVQNSPVFFADKVETPLLMLHNDEDGAVPWYQGIEMFVALRRLGKPAWLFNYNGEGHGLSRPENMLDFTKRMQQYFDFYLKDGPATKWITEGVPAVDKGRDLGLEPVSKAAVDR
ncbi:MAG: prolyl oligopeptidase family serine peptidase [Planctomycetota bacterium]